MTRKAWQGKQNDALTIPQRLVTACSHSEASVAWLQALPAVIAQLKVRWHLTSGQPFEADTGCSWVAPAVTGDGTEAVLKIGMPHMEARDEIPGLRFWAGSPTVRLLEADESTGAMLLERCVPGTSLRQLPETEQDVIIAGLLRRLWQADVANVTAHDFRRLTVMLSHWRDEALAAEARWPDKGLVRTGLALFQQLPHSAPANVLLATDLHAGNVLRAQREPWLVIDPKPFVGDPAYDATQHLFNCMPRMLATPEQTMSRFADLLHVPYERVRLWMFARAAAGPRDVWADDDTLALARRLAP